MRLFTFYFQIKVIYSLAITNFSFSDNAKIHHFSFEKFNI